jgi:DNA polymerase III epsilon subunit-like protein
MLRYFNQQWDTVPVTMIDTETTGVQPGRDRTVQVGIVRFEEGVAVGSFVSLVNPGVPIPASATAIHGITDAMVGGAPTLAEVFAHPTAIKLLEEAQYGAYNASFDRYFIPPIGEDWSWPFVDSLSFVRKHDRFVKGPGRHKLSAACERHGVVLSEAHSAGADARAAGELFYILGRKALPKHYTMGALLGWQRQQEAAEWSRFMEWKSTLPPREETSV